MHPPRPQLTLHQRQAYEGAKLFYLCFLPLTISALLICSIILHPQIITLIYDALVVGSYWVAYRYYRLCNVLDVRLVRVREGQIDFSVMCQQEKVQDMDIQVQVNQNDHIYLHKYKNTQPPPSTQQSIPHSTQPITKPPKYTCKHCKLLLPYRSRHCQKCQTCIQRYDHHCFWIGNCVGYNNHRQFYLFLLFQTINNVSVLVVGLRLHGQLGIVQDGGILYWMSVWLYLVEVGSVGFIVFTGYLFLYHSMLMVSGMTTWQHMSRSRISYLNYLKAGINPFSKGPINNIKQFWTHQPTLMEYQIPTFEQAKAMKSGCNIIENEYYSCC